MKLMQNRDFNEIDKTFLTKSSVKMMFRLFKISVWLIAPNRKNLYLSFIKLASRIKQLQTHSGSAFTVTYLKEALRLCQKALAGESTTVVSDCRVAIRRGLPLIIPGDLRLLMEAKDPVVVKVVLTMLSVFRILPSTPKLKLETITKPFSGLSQELPEIPLIMNELITKFFGNKERSYFRANKSIFVQGRRLINLTTAGPNTRSQFMGGYPVDALALSSNPHILDTFKSFAKMTNCIDLWHKLRSEIKFWHDNILSTNPSTGKVYGDLAGLNKDLTNTDHLKLGKLALKHEAAGKVRVFAMVDAWTQSLLKPLHSALFSLLGKIESDGTFHQYKPIKVLIEKGFKEFYSFDLSAATDRLPIDLQVQVLGCLFDNKEIGTLWKSLLVDRDYSLSTEEFPDANGEYRYAVGQPMGALSSWAMLALTHHVLVQIAARRSGFKSWFSDYAILGDDVVIANSAVSNAYLFLMETLGVDINLSKSLISKEGSLEFAKKLIIQGIDMSPIGPKSILQLINSPRSFKEMCLNNSLLGLHDVDVLDKAAVSCHLKDLLSTKPSVTSHKWWSTLKSTYYDLVGWFGLNIIMDLSSDLKDQGIDSLNDNERKLFDSFIKETVEQHVTQGWFKGLESDVKMYNKIRRYLSFESYFSTFPSTQDLLSNYSDMLSLSANHFHDFDDLDFISQIKLASKSQARISWPLKSKTARQSFSKTLAITKSLTIKLLQHRPDLLMKVRASSQARG